MGRQTNIKLSTTAANIIYYQRGNEFYIRTKPQHIRQTGATKQCGRLFGLAARLEKAYRYQLAPAIPFIAEGTMQKRFRTFFYQWLRAKAGGSDMPADERGLTNGFEFNTDCLLSDRFKAPITVTTVNEEQIVLTIPSFQPKQSIAAPAHTQSVVITIAAASCSLADIGRQANYSKQLTIPYNDEVQPPQQIILPIPVFSESPVLVVLRLEYIMNKNGGGRECVLNRKWLPAAIIAMICR